MAVTDLVCSVHGPSFPKNLVRGNVSGLRIQQPIQESINSDSPTLIHKSEFSICEPGDLGIPFSA